VIRGKKPLSLDLSGITFAFTAGIISIFSPCGYALLPGYISYYLGFDFTIKRGIYGGIACTLGLVTVFSTIGVLASILGSILKQIIPLLDLLAATVIIIIGATLLLEVQLPILFVNVDPLKTKGLPGLYIFGIVFGLASVGCSGPIFVSVFIHSITKGLVNGLVIFIAYAMGMGIPLVITSVLVGLAKDYLIIKIRKITPKIHRLSGIVLILIGVYLTYNHFITN
jgi:cytochrome c biogenesis protein CcdA